MGEFALLFTCGKTEISICVKESVFSESTESYKNEDKEKTEKIERFSGLVDYTIKISNLLEDLKAVERFIQSAEKQENDTA